MFSSSFLLFLFKFLLSVCACVKLEVLIRSPAVEKLTETVDFSKQSSCLKADVCTCTLKSVVQQFHPHFPKTCCVLRQNLTNKMLFKKKKSCVFLMVGYFTLTLHLILVFFSLTLVCFLQQEHTIQLRRSTLHLSRLHQS